MSQFQTIHVRHLHVQDHERIRPPIVVRGTQMRQSLCAICHTVNLHAPGFQVLFEESAVGGVIVDPQRVSPVRYVGPAGESGVAQRFWQPGP